LVVAKSKHGSGLGDLPEVILEAEYVSNLLGGAEVLLDEEATVERVEKEAKTAKVIHVASHAQPNESVPLYSHIELWPSDAHPTGTVYGRDILDWNLRAELVFLSACSTAEGLRSAAGSSISLAWSVLTSGANAVVASSWPVQDQAARKWVDAFYRSYVVHRDPAAAHAVACRELKNDPAYAHPHYWACWKVLGS
jgi:CHAT domain-containing protein